MLVNFKNKKPRKYSEKTFQFVEYSTIYAQFQDISVLFILLQ